MIAALLALSADWLTETVGPILVGAGFSGVVALVGFYALVNRFLRTEFPAAIATINGRLDTIHRDLESLEAEFRRSLIDIGRLSERVDNISNRQNRLDDTASRRRPPTPR